MSLFARAQFTICDLADPVIAETAPPSPIVDMLWMDTSESPAVLKRWNGSEWEITNSIEVGGTNLLPGTECWNETAFSVCNGVTIEDGVLTVPNGTTTCKTRHIQITGSSRYTVSFDTKADTAYSGSLVTIRFYDVENSVLSSYSFDGAASTDWSRCSHSFVSPEDAAFVSFSFSPVGGNVAYRKMKFEKGSVATSWDPAPEDTKTEMETLARRLTTAESIIEGDTIINRVLSSETYINDQSEIFALKEQQAETKLTLDNYLVNFESTKETVNGIDENFNAWFDFTREAELKIGRSDSLFSVILSNEQLAFLYKTTVASYMSGSKIYNPNLAVLNTLAMGDPESSASLQAVIDDEGISWV